MRHSVTKISVMACGDKGWCARMHHPHAHSPAPTTGYPSPIGGSIRRTHDARQSATRPWLRWPPARQRTPRPEPRTRTPATYPHHRNKAPTRAGIAKGPTSLRRWDPQCRWISSESDLRQTQRVIHLMILVTRPEPTVRPPSRIAKPRPGSMAMGWISSTEISVVSPGMTMSVPSGRVMTPVTSVVRK